MPVWHKLTKAAREADSLTVLGVIQEQHADRCRLFAQWQGFDWPILHDPINILKPRAVPMFVALDEQGVVVDSSLQQSEFETFLSTETKKATKSRPASLPNARSLDRIAQQSNLAEDWVAAGDHRILRENQSQLNAAIECYTRALEIEPQRGAAHFRLGAAMRMRYDSPVGRPQDFQQAVSAWGRALDIDPNHYIYRRRIQQYGPRLGKPYPFYDWIRQARQEITRRGERPVELVTEPVGAEIAHPAKTIENPAEPADPPDPDGRITRDIQKQIEMTTVVVPARVRKGEAVRVHVELRPTDTVHWNNEAEPLTVWIDLPEGWTAENRLLTTPQPVRPESREVRTLDFELRSPATLATADTESIRAWALYYICDERGGQCLYRRQDFEIAVRFRQ